MRKLILWAALIISLGAGTATAEECRNDTDRKVHSLVSWVNDVFYWGSMDILKDDDDVFIIALNPYTETGDWADICVGVMVFVDDQCEVSVMDSEEFECNW